MTVEQKLEFMPTQLLAAIILRDLTREGAGVALPREALVRGAISSARTLLQEVTHELFFGGGERG